MTNPFSRTSKSFVGRVMVKLRGPKKPKGAAASMAGPEQAPQAATRSTPPPLTGIESQRRSVSDTSLRPRAAAPKNASASLRPPSAPLPMILVEGSPATHEPPIGEVRTSAANQPPTRPCAPPPDGGSMPQRVDWVERHRYNPVFEEITPIDQPREDFGNVGDVHHFVTESGEQISVKTSYDEAFIWREYIGLLKVHARMGPHECVVRLRGLGKVVIDGTPRLGLLLRRVPGPSGERFFRAMDAALRDGRITSSQYWSAVQFLCDRLLSGLEHIHSADGTVHNDLLPKNFHVDATTGLPVLLDFDAWSDPANPAAIRPGMDVVGAASFAPPEASTPLAIDPRSDVYRLGATLNDLAWTRDEPMPAKAPSMLSVPAGASHAPGEAAATGSRRPPLFPEFEDFLLRTMTEDKENRLTSTQARQHPFVKNRLLSDDETQALIREIAAEVRWQAPTESDLSVSHGSSEIASQDGTSNSRRTSTQVD